MKKAEIQVKYFKEVISVKGYIHNKVWGIHHAFNRGTKTFSMDWNLTHIPSGLSVRSGLYRAKDALALAETLQRLPIPWADEEPLEGVDRETIDKAKQYTREH
jgi:hypothetical protein